MVQLLPLEWNQEHLSPPTHILPRAPLFFLVPCVLQMRASLQSFLLQDDPTYHQETAMLGSLLGFLRSRLNDENVLPENECKVTSVFQAAVVRCVCVCVCVKEDTQKGRRHDRAGEGKSRRHNQNSNINYQQQYIVISAIEILLFIFLLYLF